MPQRASGEDRPAAPGDDDAPLSPRERARLTHRERKRQTKMVLDNAGVKRLLPAAREKRRRLRPGGGPGG